MIIDLVHYNFKQEYNKWDSQHKRDLTPAQIDEILNKVTNIWFETTYSGAYGTKGLSFEETQQRKDLLANLVIKSPTSNQQAVSPFTVVDNVYEFRTSEFNYPYAHLIRASVTAIQGDCTKTIGLDIEQHDDLDEILDDPYNGPSFTWSQAPAVFGKDTSAIDTSIFVYTGGDFTIDSLFPEYLKYPNIVSIGGYTDIEGNLKATVQYQYTPRS
jgi:hypothetical protein